MRTPNTVRSVLVWVRDEIGSECWDIAFYDNGKWTSTERHGQTVLHWQELPQKPEREIIMAAEE